MANPIVVIKEPIPQKAPDYTFYSPQFGEMKIFGAEKADIAFTHDYFGSINITRVSKFLANVQPTEFRMNLQNAMDMIAVHDVDADRVIELMQEINRTGVEIKPLFFVPMPDGSHVLIDGVHRLAMICCVASEQCDKINKPYNTAVIKFPAKELAYSAVKDFLIKCYVEHPLFGTGYIDDRPLSKDSYGVHFSPDGDVRGPKADSVSERTRQHVKSAIQEGNKRNG